MIWINSIHIISGTFLLRHFCLAHLRQFSSRKHNRQHKCRCIRDRSCVHHSVNSHKQRENNNQRQQENYLSCQWHDDTQFRHSNGSKESRRHWLNPIGKCHKHKNLQITFRKLEIQITSRSKDAHDLVRKQLETGKEYRSNHCTCSYRITIRLSNSVIFLRSIIESDRKSVV